MESELPKIECFNPKSKQDKNNLLKALNKTTSKNNRNKLDTFYNIFLKEKEQDKHNDKYFYKYLYYYHRDQLTDNLYTRLKHNLDNYLNLSGKLFIYLFIIFILYLTIHHLYSLLQDDSEKLLKALNFNIALGIVSVVTGLFFVIKIYIESLLFKKEKEMLKEYQEALKQHSLEQNKIFDDRFDRLNDQNQIFNERDKEFKANQEKVLKDNQELKNKLDMLLNKNA